MGKKKRLHRVTFIDGDSERDIPPDCIGRVYETSAYSPLQAFTAVLTKLRIRYARNNFGNVDIEARVQVKDGQKWRPTLDLRQRDYMRLYDPDEYGRVYALQTGARQLRLL